MVFLFTVSCTKQVTKHAETVSTTPIRQETKPPNYTKKIKKDTLGFIVAFHDTAQRRNFAAALEKLIKNSMAPVSDDSSNAYFVKTQIVTAQPNSSAMQVLAPQSGDQQMHANAFRQTPAPEMAPKSGGSITIYTPQGYLPQALARLVDAFPFDKNSCSGLGADSGAGLCTIKQVSEKKITLTFSPAARGAADKPFSSLDVVTKWNTFVKRHPAEGKALFRYVAGIDQFINGREALIMGFQVIDDKTITMQLTQPDPFAVARLCTPRLLPASFKAGSYCIAAEKPDALTLFANARFAGRRPFLNSCEIRMGKDTNPFLAFSLNRYNAMVLFSLKDIDYARRTAQGKSELAVFSEDRYFLSVAIASDELRRFLSQTIDRKDLLTNAVKAQGVLLGAIETADVIDSGAVPLSSSPTPTSQVRTPKAGAPCSILFCSDDPVSQIIGNKVLADLSKTGINCSLKGATTEDYEKSLVKKDYDVAVGWAPKNVLIDPSERLRLSAMWFNDETNERIRVESLREIPLFSVTSYLLHSKKIGFYNGSLSGMYLLE